MKFLLWAGLIAAVIWVLRSKKKSSVTSSSATHSSANREIEAMLHCAHCGTHFPASEAVFDASNTAFCSNEHRQRHTVH
jgi:uncharacterized protein